MNTIAMIVIGFAAGFLGGMFGVGGGVLMVPALLFIFQERIPSVHVAVGTSMAVIVATSIAGTVQHALSGRVEWGIVAPLAVFAAVGGMFGAYVSGLVEKAVLQRLFAVFLIVVALKMLISRPSEPRAPADRTVAVGSDASDRSDRKPAL